MNNVDILGFLGPLVPLLFAGTFCVFWLGQRNAPHILLTGCAFAIFSISLFLRQYVFDTPDFIMVTTTGSLDALALIMFAYAMSLRLDIETPITLLIATAFTGIFAGGVASIAVEDIGLRFVIISSTFGMLMLIAALNMLRAPAQTRVNITIVFILVSGSIISIGSPLLAWKLDYFGTLETFKTATYWSILNFSIALMSIILSMALVVAFANDLVSKIKNLSDLDVLTGVKTRRAFEMDAKAIFAQHARSNLPVSLIVTDLDHFKAINDQFGHFAGDRVLAALGNLMTNALRTTDIIGRMGGEEFCIILWNTSEDGAVFVAEGLRSRFENTKIPSLPDSQHVTASFGVIEVGERESFASAFERADKSMYFAKQTGRNRVCVGNKLTQTPSLSVNNDDQYWSDTVRTATLN